jgi:hypothetical protein
MDAFDLLLAIACFVAGYAVRAAISQVRRQRARRLRAREAALRYRSGGHLAPPANEAHLTPIGPAIN